MDIASTARRVLLSAERGMFLNHERKHLGDNVVKDSLRKDQKYMNNATIYRSNTIKSQITFLILSN